VDETEHIVGLIKQGHPDVFPEKLDVTGVVMASPVKKEIAMEYGLNAESFFLIILNDKKYSALIPNVISWFKDGFHDMVILHGNSVKM
jgi:hypothetical protein